jgi:ADP-heptose:LPS heptosyltransferase
MLKLIEKSIKTTAVKITAAIWHKKIVIKSPINIKDYACILIYRPEKIGDLFVSLPLVTLMKRENPNLKIDALISPQALPLIDGDLRFNKIYIYRKKLLPDISTSFRVRKNNYDAIFDLVGSDSATAAMTALFIAKRRALKISIGKKKLAHYYDSNYEIFKDRHMIESTMRPLALFGIEYSRPDFFAPPHIGSQIRERAGKFIRDHALAQGTYPVGINISAGNKNRRWPENGFRLLLKKIIDSFPDMTPVIISSPEDYEKAKSLADSAAPQAIVIPAGLNLQEVFAFVAQMKLFISSDTSLIHIARSLQIPVVGLYIPFNDNYRRWGPLLQKEGVLVAGNDEAIDSITAEQVMSEIIKVLPVRA